MMRGLAAALFLCCGLAACNPNDVPPATQLFSGRGDVNVLDAHIVPSGDGSAATSGGTLGYVIARVEFTNDLGADLTPQVDHFYLIDRNGNRYQAKDSGSAALTGIANSQAPLKKDEKRTYTLGFRTSDPNVSGTIIYER